MNPDIIECELKVNMEKIMAMGISRNLDINVTVQFNTTVTEDVKLAYLCGKWNHIVEGILWNRKVPKQCKQMMYKVYFKLMFTYNAETWTLTKRNNIWTVGMIFFNYHIQGKPKRDSFKSEILREGVEFKIYWQGWRRSNYNALAM